MKQNPQVLGIDFGTSNSAAGYLCGGKPQLIRLHPGQHTIPTTVFFDFEAESILFGEVASRAFLNGLDGRFMRSIKRVLGTSLMNESRIFFGKEFSFVDVVSSFLHHIKSRAEFETGNTFDQVVSGRPVYFHENDDKRDTQAEADLRACYLKAGFKKVKFVLEPAAAAISCGAVERSGDVGLIVDIGGGTSDFSLFRSLDNDVEILAVNGLRLGGTDFDRMISLDRVMPLLGKGTQIRKEMGLGSVLTPNKIFNDLATWETIHSVYTLKIRRMVKEMSRLAHEPEKLDRLITVLTDELGHELASSVERAKIAASSGSESATISLNSVEQGLLVSLPLETVASILSEQIKLLRSVAEETLILAGMSPRQVNHVVYVGGSSLLPLITDVMSAVFDKAQHSSGNAFTAVADGLALSTVSLGSGSDARAL